MYVHDFGTDYKELESFDAKPHFPVWQQFLVLISLNTHTMNAEK